MPEPLVEFALNQKTASRLGFADFLDLAADLGCVGVEPRNDLGRPFFDGFEPERAAGMARERGLRLLGLSEVYPFDDWNAERRAAVAALIEVAAASGAETISLIPRVDVRDPDADARAAALRAVVSEIAPMLAGINVVALLEPIGFANCSMRFQREAAAAIESLNLGDRFGIVHDTFQHALAKDADFLVPHIRTVHISGVADGSGDLTDDHDAERVLVDETDRTDALGQMGRLITAGYRGPFSFECTAPRVREDGNLRAAIAESFAYLRRELQSH
jgi:2-keto-myo-inositol isomerase